VSPGSASQGPQVRGPLFKIHLASLAHQTMQCEISVFLFVSISARNCRAILAIIEQHVDELTAEKVSQCSEFVCSSRQNVASNSTAPITCASIINSSNWVEAAVEGNLGNASAPRSLIVMVPLSSDLPQWLGFANSAMKASAFQAVVRALTRHNLQELSISAVFSCVI
jgi:hypothetical protein